MNVLFLTLLDFSSVDEDGIYTDLLREFVRDGHNVSIISPTEKRKNEPTRLIYDRNIRILKLQIGNIQKTHFIEKGISTLTLETKFKSAIKKHFNDTQFDLVLYSTPPITLQKAVEFVKQRDNAKSYLLLKDIFPQNAVDLGIIKKSGLNKITYRYFRKKEQDLYKASDYIGCMSEANVRFVIDHNTFIPADTVEVCPNSLEPKEISFTEKEKQVIREEYGIPIEKTIFIYGGNLGKPQGIDFLIECLKSNEEKDNSFFLIVGAGTEHYKLSDYFSKEKPRNSRLLKQLPKAEFEKMTAACDVGLIFLDRRFTIPNFPSRILSYMQASIPVLAATDVNTDIGSTITDGEFGYWCESGDINKFNELVDSLCDRELRAKLGHNARTYLNDNYTTKNAYEIIMKHFTQMEEGHKNV